MDIIESQQLINNQGQPPNHIFKQISTPARKKGALQVTNCFLFCGSVSSKYSFLSSSSFQSIHFYPLPPFKVYRRKWKRRSVGSSKDGGVVKQKVGQVIFPLLLSIRHYTTPVIPTIFYLYSDSFRFARRQFQQRLSVGIVFLIMFTIALILRPHRDDHLHQQTIPNMNQNINNYNIHNKHPPGTYQEIPLLGIFSSHTFSSYPYSLCNIPFFIWSNFVIFSLINVDMLRYTSELFVLWITLYKGFREIREIYNEGIVPYFSGSGSAFMENILR